MQPSRSPPPTPLGNPVGNRHPNSDDQEVTFLRGEGGFPQDQPFQPAGTAQPDRGVGSPSDNLLNPQLPLNLVWMWGI